MIWCILVCSVNRLQVKSSTVSPSSAGYSHPAQHLLTSSGTVNPSCNCHSSSYCHSRQATLFVSAVSFAPLGIPYWDNFPHLLLLIPISPHLLCTSTTFLVRCGLGWCRWRNEIVPKGAVAIRMWTLYPGMTLLLGWLDTLLMYPRHASFCALWIILRSQLEHCSKHFNISTTNLHLYHLAH